MESFAVALEEYVRGNASMQQVREALASLEPDELKTVLDFMKRNS